MKISSFYKQAIRTVQFSIAALICSVALNFGTAAPSLAAQLQVAPTPHLALFGWGEKAEGKAEQLVGKVQAKTGQKIEGTAKQIDGRAKYDLGRVEDGAQRTADKAGKMAKEMKKGTDKNLSKAGDSMKDTANNMVDGTKKIINN
ncbi:hypothetical protein [Chamaesiphon sp. VAR_48_metabat_135_sub]|uniref:CsbD family protein n=1 Tax=Chamaesiphon sp. VAR_48_metabat_135_sub TaxID=2964699 RepID=UPI00286B6D5C|nr:hypothetical protein [Chamaesiphon sp. VAR_48_metabat_135_sub]